MKNLTRLIGSAAILLLTAILIGLAYKIPEAFFACYHKVSEWLLDLLSYAFGWIPAPVWQILTILLIVWGIGTLIFDLKHGKIFRWLTGVVLGASVGVFLFVVLWGAGHFGPTKTEQFVTLREYSKTELADAAYFYGRQASLALEQMPHDADGNPVYRSFAEQSRIAEAAYHRLAEETGAFPNVRLRAKKLWMPTVFSYTGTTGIFVPFTAEICVNGQTYPASQPETICHEMSHRLGAYNEEDANFCAFLACIASGEPEFLYSGCYTAFIYCYNALHEIDPKLASEVWYAALSEGAAQSLTGANEYYAAYEGKVQDAAQSVNDAYLKAFGEEEGVQSYGLVSDALVAWYQKFMAKR